MSYIKYDKEIMDEISQGYLIGVLASENDHLPFIGYDREPITIMKNSNDTVISYIKPICDEHEYIKNKINPYIPCSDVYINLDYHSSRTGIYISGYDFLSGNAKCEINRDVFENNLIVFKPKISISGDRVHKNVSLVKVIENNDLDLNSKYISVPIVKTSIDEFEFNLFKENRITISDGIKACCAKDYVLCGNRFYGIFDDWYKTFGTPNGWLSQGKEDVNYIDLDFNDDEFKKNVIIINDEIAFISRPYLEKLDRRLTSEENHLNLERFTDENYQLHNNNESALSSNLNEAPTENTGYETMSTFNIITSTQVSFLKQFQELTIKKGLSYKFEDLVNFHISIKTNPLTIVAGMTGTGKTQIAKCYADLLGLSVDNGKLLFLPISPSYTEPQDVLGYLNTNTGLYTTADTGLVDILLRACNDSNSIYMVIFDEMNLSQIEHWFAPFLSLLELSEKDRILSLYGEGQICHNSSKYPSYITIPDNIIFVGTVNLDETTKDFSDRVLDRANIISLVKNKFFDLYKTDTTIANTGNLEQNDIIDFYEFSSWIKKSKGIKGLTEEEVLFLDKLDEFLTSEDSQKGISFRLIEKISSYIENIPENIDGKLLVSRRDAFDLILLQRLLTRLRGSERELDGLISQSYGGTTEHSPLYNIFDSEDAKLVSDFKLVKSRIAWKEKELEKYGYTN